MGKKRKRGQTAAENIDKATHDPTANGAPTRSALAKSKRKKRIREEEVGGDTPKAFLNLIHHRERVQQSRSHAEDSDKWKKDAALATEAAKLIPRPGEIMSDFHRRVDAAMPIKYAKSSNSGTQKVLDVEDFAERRAKKQSARQKKQNEEHLNMLKNKHEKRIGATEKDFDDYEFSTLNKTDRGRKKSPDPWAVLLKPERVYKFNESVEAPPILTNRGKFVKRALPSS